MKILKVALLIIVAIPFMLYFAAAVLSRTSGIRTLFEREVRDLAARHPSITHEAISTDQLAALPAPVRDYLESTGFASHEKIEFVAARYRGDFALSAGKYSKIKCEQYNSLPLMTRIWYGKVTLAPFIYIEGRHLYENGRANMLIKFGPFTIADVKGREIDQSDTITIFNDMFLFMPSAIINEHSNFEAIDDKRCSVTYSFRGIRLSAQLYFNDTHELVDFITDDRYRLEGTSSAKCRWSTPITAYRISNGLNEVHTGGAKWVRPQGDEYYFIINGPEIKREYNDEGLRMARGL